jgi:hypothetical protein
MISIEIETAGLSPGGSGDCSTGSRAGFASRRWKYIYDLYYVNENSYAK